MTCIYAEGDIARTSHSISWVVADGVTAGTSAHLHWFSAEPWI